MLKLSNLLATTLWPTLREHLSTWKEVLNSTSEKSKPRPSESLKVLEIKRPPSPEEKFFLQYADFAMATQKMTEIPASVTLAQAALESGYGKHAPQYNFFGIKGTGPAGSQKLATWEYEDGKPLRKMAAFRSYHNALESFMDHAQVISKGKYLKHAMNHTESATEFIRALQSGKYRYATDPLYSSKILKLIQRFGLENYDYQNKNITINEVNPKI